VPPSLRLPELRVGAVLAIAIAAGLGAWLGTRGGGHHTTTATTPATTPTVPAPTVAGPTGKRVVPVTLSGLETVATALKQPIYWAGRQPGTTYELTELPNGSVYVRYLPPGTTVGASKLLLTVGTYPVTGAFAAAERSAVQAGSVRVSGKSGAVAFYGKTSPTNVYLAFPGSDYQIEVFDPSASEARRLVEAGQIAPVPSSQAAPAVLSPARLKALAHSLGHPLYWAGLEAGTANEVTQTPDGRVYIRYLPKGTKAGANEALLAVGTYPVRGAFATTLGLAKRSDSVQVPVIGGGVAFYAKSAPTSVYIAFPGSSYQIEVYDPSPAQAKQLVTSGKIVPIR
jgi:hypothetical protein